MKRTTMRHLSVQSQHVPFRVLQIHLTASTDDDAKKKVCIGNASNVNESTLNNVIHAHTERQTEIRMSSIWSLFIS